MYGLSSAVVSTATIGIWDKVEPWPVTELDRAYGYDAAYAIANASGNILVGVASGGAGCLAAKSGSMVVKGIGYGIKIADIGGNAVGLGKNSYDIYENGPNIGNVIGFAGNAGGLAGNLKSACFTAGTQVVVGAEYDENGNFVCYVTANIEDIKVGDLVYSYNTLTGETELREVTATFVRESDHINLLTIIDENGVEQTIETTDGHPFWVVTDNPDLSRAARSVVDENGFILYHENIEPGLNGYWVEAKDLRVGDVFLGANGELSTLINAVRIEQSGGIAVFNFSVEGNHNYFILAKEYEYGQTCILVHNAENYFVRSGVHRSVVARETGMTKIKAEIIEDEISQGIKEISLGNLHTSKDHIMRDRFNDVRKAIEAEGMKNPIQVEKLGLPGQETPTTCIIDVFIF